MYPLAKLYLVLRYRHSTGGRRCDADSRPPPPWLQVLNQNPGNFHNDNEAIAFSPGAVVPGIGYSEDKLLQTRIFSYADTQRYRLGGNYLQLPINAPKCPFHNNHHDGVGNMVARTEEVRSLSAAAAATALATWSRAQMSCALLCLALALPLTTSTLFSHHRTPHQPCFLPTVGAPLAAPHSQLQP